MNSWRCSTIRTGCFPSCSGTWRSPPRRVTRRSAPFGRGVRPPPIAPPGRRGPRGRAARRSGAIVSPVPLQTRDALLDWRSEFPTVEATLHFVSHSLGAMPRGVEEALRLYAQTWKSRGIRAWEEGWFDLPATLGGLVGQILNAEPESVSFQPNVTLAQAAALSAIDFRPPRNR